MTRNEVMQIIAARRNPGWSSFCNPWGIQADLLALADYIEQNDNPFQEEAPPPPDTSALQKTVDEQAKALKALRAWFLMTYGPNAAFGPPRDLLQDKFQLSPRPAPAK